MALKPKDIWDVCMLSIIHTSNEDIQTVCGMEGRVKEKLRVFTDYKQCNGRC
jgi:hypothetical protein